MSEDLKPSCEHCGYPAMPDHRCSASVIKRQAAQGKPEMTDRELLQFILENLDDIANWEQKKFSSRYWSTCRLAKVTEIRTLVHRRLLREIYGN